MTDAPTTPPPPLTPLSLGVLLERIAHEWETRHKIFDLPSARIWKRDPDLDLSFDFLGHEAASPVGPAAGPHSQMAQNIVLAWLGGSRLFELKTVQVIDDLEIGRPCIDMTTIGYNIEWSQELEVQQSLDEYVKAWMIIEILSRWEPLRDLIGDPGPHVFDMSVGYDLAGVETPKVAAFIDGMRDASAVIERLRPEIPEAFAEFRDLDFDPRLADTITLSTFHGCPPDEIESITKHLIDHHDVSVIVKLNPTLLGFDTVCDIVNDQLGYTEVQLTRDAFDADLQFDRGIALIGELRDYAQERGKAFGIKLTNTLVVSNHKGWMPDETMYLSGPPLHVLASSLLAKLATALPGQLRIPGHDGDIMVSFSAGITRDNLPGALAMGVGPATICSDLLKPGGYGRLAPMLKALAKEITGAGHTSLASWKAEQLTTAQAAGHADAVSAHVAEILSPDGIGDYHLEGNSKLPRAVEHDLEMFDCVACNFCITVCPNDAFFSIKSLEEHDARQQYLVFSELCNECGNCMTFCPEVGDPAMIKPRLYTDRAVFDARADLGQAFLIRDDGTVEARPGDDAAAAVVQELLTSEAGNPLG